MTNICKKETNKDNTKPLKITAMKNFRINYRYSATGEIASYTCKADNACEARKKFRRQHKNPYGGRRMFIEIVQF